MDLTTLSNLLEEHASTLTRLYASLGAPASTVSGKLEELHDALISTVKNQRTSAEQEVERVQSRVNDLRVSCERKRKRLGEGRTSQGNTDGVETLMQAQTRLEKEEKETDRLVKQREDLYQGHLSRLEAFIPVLGRETVFVDDTDSRPAHDASDLSLTCLSRLEKEIHRCESEVRHREELLAQLLRDVVSLWADLGFNPIDDEITILDDERQLSLDILRTAGEPVPENASSSCTLLVAKQDIIDQLQKKKELLEMELSNREREIQKLYDELYLLWSKLGVSDEEADSFVEAWAGAHQRCIDAYRNELARMLQVKADNMLIFIAKEREEIASLWDELFYSEEERRQFDMCDSNINTDDVLAEHENEKLRLLEEKAAKAPILAKLRKYFELLDEAAQLLASANDPARLTGKGQRGDPGRLLREEKSRKRIAVQKPKLELDLINSLPIWENEHNQPFLINGTRFLEDLTAKVEMEHASRGASKRSKTPVASSSGPPASLKRQNTGTASAIQQSGPTTAKRARSNTLSSASAQASSAANIQRPMHTGSSTMSSILATPCPPPSNAAHLRAGGLMLVPNSGTTASNTASRLPLKSQTTGFAATHLIGGGHWQQQQLGLYRQQSSGLPMPGQSLFSPHAENLSQQQKPVSRQPRPSFRPRPSILSNASAATSSAPSVSSSSWAGLRTVSTATSVNSRGSGCSSVM